MASRVRIGAEILSVDSMQVYRGMDVGTAKPTPAEQAAVRHHLIDVVEPSETVHRRAVRRAGGRRRSRTRRGAACRSSPPAARRCTTRRCSRGCSKARRRGRGPCDRLRAVRTRSSHRRLSEADPAAAGADPRERPQAARAGAGGARADRQADLVVPDATGRRRSQRHAATWVGLDWDREALNRRINARVKAMMAAGWVEEARRLLRRYGTLSQTAAEATGYRELIEHLSGQAVARRRGRADQDRHAPARPPADEVVQAVSRTCNVVGSAIGRWRALAEDHVGRRWRTMPRAASAGAEASPRLTSRATLGVKRVVATAVRPRIVAPPQPGAIP